MPFNSSELRKFAKQWHFVVITTSPNYPQSNGLIERNVQTIKRLYKKAIEGNTSFDLALLEYRNTPISGMDLSPAQLLMSRRLRSTLPMTHSLLAPAVNKGVTKQLKDRQERQQVYYDKGARPLLPLSKGDTVQYRTGNRWQPAVVISRCLEAPRSYLIKNVNNRTLRRNRRHLKRTSQSIRQCYFYDDDDYGANGDNSDVNDHQQVINRTEQMATTEEHVLIEAPSRVSRYGRPINPPRRYVESDKT